MNDLQDQLILELKRYAVKPNKRLGQFFVIDSRTIQTMVELGQISPADTVLEIGPGFGGLTQALGRQAARGLVVALEKDFKLVTILSAKFKNWHNIKIVHTDALAFEYSVLVRPFKVVANLPYQITSPIIRRLIDESAQLMVLMVQKEVGQRISARPGDSKRGVLTIIIELFGLAELVQIVPRTSFFPKPDVEGAIIRLTPKRDRTRNERQNKIVMLLAKAGFSGKRRQIHNSLSAGLRLSKRTVLELLKSAKINPGQRAQELSLKDWQRLAVEYSSLIASKRAL